MEWNVVHIRKARPSLLKLSECIPESSCWEQLVGADGRAHLECSTVCSPQTLCRYRIALAMTISSKIEAGNGMKAEEEA